MLATGSEAVIPPVPGLRELDGVWTNREVTGLREVPRRLLVLGAGPVGLDRVEVDARMRIGGGLWAIGDVTGIWPLTYVGKYQGRIAAANILGEPRDADYSAVSRVVFTDPQAAAVGEPDGPVTATVSLAGVPRTATYTRAYAKRPGYLTLVYALQELGAARLAAA